MDLTMNFALVLLAPSIFSLPSSAILPLFLCPHIPSSLCVLMWQSVQKSASLTLRGAAVTKQSRLRLITEGNFRKLVTNLMPAEYVIWNYNLNIKIILENWNTTEVGTVAIHQKGICLKMQYYTYTLFCSFWLLLSLLHSCIDAVIFDRSTEICLCSVKIFFLPLAVNWMLTFSPRVEQKVSTLRFCCSCWIELFYENVRHPSMFNMTYRCRLQYWFSYKASYKFNLKVITVLSFVRGICHIYIPQYCVWHMDIVSYICLLACFPFWFLLSQ